MIAYGSTLPPKAIDDVMQVRLYMHRASGVCERQNSREMGEKCWRDRK